MLFSLLIASAGVASTAGIGPIKNPCGSDGVVPNSYMVTLKTPASAHPRDLGYLNRWFRQYNPGSDRRNPARAVHYFTKTQFAVAIEASNNVAMRMATADPAVVSVDYNCFRQFSSSIPESGDSLPGRDSPDLDDEVAAG